MEAIQVVRIEHTETGLGVFRSEDENDDSHCFELSFYRDFTDKHQDMATPREHVKVVNIKNILR